MVTGRRCALVIAVHEYQDPDLSSLYAPAHDAQALAAVLRDPAIGDFEVTTLVNESSMVIAENVEEFFADRSSDDLLLLHFSCHGIKDMNGDLYFAAANTRVRRLAATAVAAEFVNRLMHRSRARRIVVLLDCCYAGAFDRGTVARADRSVGIGERFAGRGRAVITASNAVEYAYEGGTMADLDAHRPSFFTGAVVQALRTGEADADRDGFISVDELYDYIFDKVREQTASQTPGKWTYAVQGELFIARSVREPGATARPFPAYDPSRPATGSAVPYDGFVQSDPNAVPADRMRGQGTAQAPASARSRLLRRPSRPRLLIATGVGIAIVATAAAVGVPRLGLGAGDAKAKSPHTSAPTTANSPTHAATASPPIGTTVFQDDFSNHKLWPDDNAQTDGGHYADGGYVVYAAPVAKGGYQGHSPDSAAGAVYPEAPVDISISVDARELSGEGNSGYGVECHSGPWLSGYVFSIWGTNASIEKLTSTGLDVQGPVADASSAIDPSGTNHLVVSCTNAADGKAVELKFWINSRLVDSYTDIYTPSSSPLLTGSIALVAGTGSTVPTEPIEVQFNNLVVQRL